MNVLLPLSRNNPNKEIHRQYIEKILLAESIIFQTTDIARKIDYR